MLLLVRLETEVASAELTWPVVRQIKKDWKAKVKTRTRWALSG